MHGATSSWSAAQSNAANAADPTQRLIYVGGQTPASGGGAIELIIPSDAWVIYGYQWPEASRANAATNAIVFRQGGERRPQITVYRQDGPDGHANYNPLFPFKMRGSVDQYGNPVMAPGEGNVSNLTYAIDVPVVTNAQLRHSGPQRRLVFNTLVKLDGGIDLNSQMGLGPTNFQPGLAPTNFLDLRDNPPGLRQRCFSGLRADGLPIPQRAGKIRRAEHLPATTLSRSGAETYYYTVGGANTGLCRRRLRRGHHQPDGQLGLSRSGSAHRPS